MANTFPAHVDDMEYAKYGPGSHGPDAQMTVIGGTHHVSTKLDPDKCLRGEYQAINGDSMPSGAPVDGSPPYMGPILPEN